MLSKGEKVRVNPGRGAGGTTKKKRKTTFHELVKRGPCEKSTRKARYGYHKSGYGNMGGNGAKEKVVGIVGKNLDRVANQIRQKTKG